MIVRAIRLQEFRRFSEPVEVAGLTGGLDVLAAPNEQGKSTIFRALRLILNEKYSAGGKKIARWQPYSGGAPRVEVDMEIDGQLYRVGKQFVKSKDAWVHDAVSGREVARKDEAEAWIADVVRAHSGIDLLWVAQGESLAPIAPGAGETEVLQRAVEAEVEVVAGGELAARVRTVVAGELDERMSSRGPRGAYREAIAERDRLTQEHDRLKARAKAAEERLEQLARARERRETLREPAARRAREKALADAQRAEEQASQALAKVAAAEQALQTRKSLLEGAQERLAAHDTKIADLAALKVLHADTLGEAAGLNETRAVIDQRVEQARKALEDLDRQEADCRARLKRIAAAEKRAAAEQRLSELRDRHSEAKAAAETVTRLEKQLAANRATHERLQVAERAERAILVLCDRLAQVAPQVTVRYEPGTASSVQVGGEVLEDGARVSVDEVRELRIAGVGTLTVDPRWSADVEENRTALAQEQEERRSALAAIGAEDLAKARALHESRGEVERELQRARDRLALIAPDGLDVMSEAVIRLEALLTEIAETADDPGDAAVVEAELEDLVTRREKAARELESARQEREQINVQRGEVRSAVSQQELRIKSIEAGLPSPDQRDTVRTGLEEEASNSQVAVNTAVRELSAWQEKAPGEEQMQALTIARERAEDVAGNAERELRMLDEEIARLDGALAEAREDGMGEMLLDLADRLAVAETRVEAHRREADALALLNETLDDVAVETRETYMQPVARRLRPYFDLVFPQSQMSLTTGFAVDGLNREGGEEPVSALSDGTQEQIAILVRLGFGRLFADRGNSIPVVLDDALVFSDDERIERVFNALHLAARYHQVIVLTCRTRAFEPLGGNRLQIRVAEAMPVP